MTAAATLLLALVMAQGHGTRTVAKTVAKSGAAASKSSGASATRTRGGSDGAQKGGGDSGDKAGSGDADSGKAKGARETRDDASASGESATGGKTLKTKTYNFGAMDVEGKLKTPQLLYFLNRVKLELDMSAPDKRSFMKELEKSADDKSL